MKRYIVRGWGGDVDYEGECDYKYCATEADALEAGVHFEDEYDFVEIYDTERDVFL